MTVLGETRRVDVESHFTLDEPPVVHGYHPVLEFVDMVLYDVPALGGSAVKGFFSLFRGNMPSKPLAQHGEQSLDMYLDVHPEAQRTE